jgi:SAM-dependent methyltransferase
MTTTELGFTREPLSVADGVPCFVGNAGYAASFGLQWRHFARTQLDSHNGSSYSRDRLCATAGWDSLPDLSGRRVLEAGSGAGRFTEVLAQTGAEVWSFDYTEAALVNHRNNGGRRNVRIFRADLYSIPLPPASFDIVCCLGVLQHTPDVRRSFRSLAEMVAPGGLLVVDAYSRALRQRLHWKYLLRPFTTRMAPERLFDLCQRRVPRLMPAAAWLRRLAPPLVRLVPIMDMSNRRLPAEIQKEWCILDTFDALAAAYDQPQSARTLRRWYAEAGFEQVQVRDGTIVRARGRRPPSG